MYINLYKPDKKEICLPIAYPPLITAYLPISIVSNIAVANSNNLNWIMQNFVQIFKYEKSDKVESFPIQKFIYQQQATITINEINGHMIDMKRISIVEDIVKWIDEKKYVVVYLDESRIEGMRLYEKYAFLHSQFIFGYNLEKRVFKVLNFSQDTKNMKIIDVGFESLAKNFYSEQTAELYTKDNVSLDLVGKKYRIVLLSYNDCCKYIDNTLNKEVMREQIRQYVYSINSSMYTSYFTGNVKGKWGLSVYEEIKQLLQKQKDNLDIRYICLLYEHKVFMRERLEYFDKELTNQYQEVVKKAKILKMLCLKYIYTKQQKLFDRIIKLISDIQEEEKEILIQVINI